MFERSELADFRGFHVRPLDTPELKALTEAGRCVPDEVEPLPARPPLPDDWQLAPNVMFREGDPEPEPLDWGRHKWATVEAYDQDLAKQLVDLACGRDTPEAQARALARRALSDLADHADDPWGDPDRLWPRLFAARVSGPDCPQARRLPEDLRRPLDELAILDHAVVTSPAAYPPYPAE